MTDCAAAVQNHFPELLRVTSDNRDFETMLGYLDFTRVELKE